MEDVRQLVQEEGREARNLVAFHVAVDNPARISRKPPKALPPTRRLPSRATRLRSASAGRDKRSELRARYWALLFGDLQRAVGEIYNTVEAHENLNECQEVILVLENYTRDFKALSEWFRLKWEYDNTPPPQRPQSLAWEIRKTDFVRPESRRTYSVKSSPPVSGKNSPCLSGHTTPSGKNSPNLTGKASPASGKRSPRTATHSNFSPKGNIEFFSNKIVASKIAAKPEPNIVKESRLSDIKEKDAKETNKNLEITEIIAEDNNRLSVEKEVKRDLPIVSQSPKQSVTLANDKKKSEQSVASPSMNIVILLEEMENNFLNKNIRDSKVKSENMINEDINGKNSDNIIPQLDNNILTGSKKTIAAESPSKSGNKFADDSNDVNIITTTTTTADNKSESSITNGGNINIASESIKTSLYSNGELNNNEGLNPNLLQLEKEKDQLTFLKKIETLRGEDTFEKEKKDKASDLDMKLIENTLQHTSLPDMEKSNENKKLEAHKEKLKELCIDTQKKILIKDDNIKEQKKEILKEDMKKESETKNADQKTAIDVKTLVRPAYSQAAAKPKPSGISKSEAKTPIRLMRSSTVVEMRPSTPLKPQRSFQKKIQINRCSYPFNLTTGRTSLFDAPGGNTNRVNAVKRPTSKNAHLSSGDGKYNNTHKLDEKKRPPRPSSLKLNKKMDIKDKDLNLDNINDFQDHISSKSITQADMSRIESTESLKTLVPEDYQRLQDIANSVEVLNMDNSKNDNDGWLTVKSKRITRESKKQSKFNWANRYNQPSATTSLPTLNMLESPKQEIKDIVDQVKHIKGDRAQSEQPPPVENPEEKAEPKTFPKHKSTQRAKDSSMLRQKSDVTGLKTRSSKNKAMNKKSGKRGVPIEDEYSELTSSRLHSSLESLTTALARSQESTEDAFDFDKWKAEFKSTFKYFEDDDHISDHDEILKGADPSEMSEIAKMTCLIEENERKMSLALDFQCEVDQRKLCEEEDLLNRQILELQQVSDIDIDTETDDTETDAEILCEDPPVSSTIQDSLGSLAASLEDQYETALAGMSWAERVNTLVVLEALVARDPGRAQQLHEKLSQGIKRRGSLQDALRRLQAKQARAEQQRMEYQTERAKKIHQLLARVEEVKVAKNQLIEDKRLRMERRLQKAAENRDQYLKDIVRKAHDEEEKLREIAFIKQLEAENRRHEFLDQCRSHNSRLREMRRDQLDKLEAKAAREAAVGERRAALEEARRLHVDGLMQRRRERHARLEQLRERERRRRGDAAREKAESVKSRLSALAAAAEMEADALRCRIRDKQDASQMRLECHLQAIRERATGPRQPTTSESQEQIANELEEEAKKIEQEKKEKEKQKNLKKKARKMKQRLLTSGIAKPVFEDNMSVVDPLFYPITNKIYKVLSTLNNIASALDDNKHPTNGHEAEEEKPKKKKKSKLSNGETAREIGEKGKADENSNLQRDKINDDHKTNQVNNGKTFSKGNKVNIGAKVCNGEKTSNEEKLTKVEKINGEILINGEEVSNGEILSNGGKMSEDREQKKKNKKKNKNFENVANISKTSSVCSSLSDMSKTSARSEKPKVTAVDLSLLEKQLNELYRAMEKFDRNTTTKTSLQRFHTLKVISDLLEIAAEREEVAAQLSPKCVTTAVVLMSRAMQCGPAAAQWITTNSCVHLITLLARQLEKDLQSDAREMELAKQLSDCISVTFDSVLCFSRLYQERGSHVEDKKMLGVLRNRTHLLICYLCVSGCISRAERAGEARESVQTLLTVCADLCHPNETDTGSERDSAKQALRSALGKSICGSRAEFCLLFAEGASLEQCGGFVRAARTAHLLRTIAEMDHMILQEAFGEGRWPLEFRAAVARLLSQHAPNEKEAPRTTSTHAIAERLDQTLSETMVLDLIVLVGFVVVNNTQLQETICDGWSVIKTLCTLPANWLVSRERSHALLPTLLALAERPASAAAISSELSMEMLEEFLENPNAQKIKLIQVLKQGQVKKSNGSK